MCRSGWKTPKVGCQRHRLGRIAVSVSERVGINDAIDLVTGEALSEVGQFNETAVYRPGGAA